MVVLLKGMMPNDSKRVYIATQIWIFTSIESSACRKDVFDEVQRVDYDKILIFRSDTLVFTDSSRKCYIFWYGSWITKQLSSQGRLIKDVYLTRSVSFVKFKMFLEKYANFNGWSEHNEVGIFTLMKLSKEFDSIMNGKDACRVTRN